MSENLDEATGRSTDEPLTGRAGLEHDAGYAPMPAEAQEELTANEAAEEKADHRGTSEANIVTHIAGVDMPKNMTMTLEQGVKALSELRADFQHLRRWRKSVEQAQSYTFKAVITVLVTGFVGAVWLGIKVMLGK